MKQIRLIIALVLLSIFAASCDTAYHGYHGNKNVHVCKSARGLVGYGNF